MGNRKLNIKGILTDSFEMIYESAIYLLLFEIIYIERRILWQI